jgi:hypothetical protein
MDPAREQLQRIEKKLDRILNETTDLKLRMSLIEQRLTIFDARLDRLEVRMDRIDQKFDLAGRKAPAPPPALQSEPPVPRNPPPVPALLPDREQEEDWFGNQLEQQLENDRRYRNEDPNVVPHRAFTRFDRS